ASQRPVVAELAGSAEIPVVKKSLATIGRELHWRQNERMAKSKRIRQTVGGAAGNVSRPRRRCRRQVGGRVDVR
ncbi:hypothetical protein LSAT2_008939, partial [Lamellibrachia satsuma]